MRRVLAILLVIAFAVIMSTTIIMAKECTYKAHKSDKKISKFVCYLVTPWPWRHLCQSEDTDMDGVVDRKDKCPGTPKGAVVDEYGCPLDADGDGVFDGIDKCPDTPKKAKVDKKGCPLDSDGDGVFDGIDTCPDTPKNATVDKKGCPNDSDGDGVFDGVDMCPDTPKKATVDKRGCPKDSDGDGVWDGVDRCPNTPIDLEVDKQGCPIEITETEMQLLDTGMIRTTSITFETGKAEIKPESYKAIDEIGAVLVQWPDLEIEVGGHTDSQGSEAINQKLSEERAKAVHDYLVKKYPKIGAGKLSVKGYGESTPIADNKTAAGRAKNRRVEFTVLNKEELKHEMEHKGFKRK